MPIRFKCVHCKRALRVPDTLAGRKNICPACRKPIIIPKPKPKPSAAQVEALAAAMLSDGQAKQPAKPKNEEAKPIKFTCDFCSEDVQVPATAAGTKMPCPECRRIIRVPVPNEDKPKDWRDIIKKGPMGAKINQPEELENAWGTEQTQRVTRQSLEDADAIPTKVEQTSLAVWLKRGFIGVMAIGFVYLAYSGISRSRTEGQEKDTIAQAVKLAEKLPAEWAAEIHRVAGELYCAKRKPFQAQKHFRAALASLQRSQKTGVDVDMLLIDLALAQVDLGGSEDEIISKERLVWTDVQKDLGQTLESLSPDARSLFLRLVGTRLGERKQFPIAIGLAGSSAPQLVGLRLAYKAALEIARSDQDKEVSDKAKKKLADDFERQPDKRLTPPKGGVPIDSQERLAHVEGLARQGKYKEALELACDRRETESNKTAGEALHCLEACVSGAELALANKQLPEVSPFVQKALPLISEAQPRPWLVFQVVRAGLEANVDGTADLIKTLPPEFQPYVQLLTYRQKLAKSKSAITTPDGMDMVTASKAQRELLTWPLSWQALARHNARLRLSRNETVDLSRFAEDDRDRIKAFMLIGFALGVHDLSK